MGVVKGLVLGVVGVVGCSEFNTETRRRRGTSETEGSWALLG
jgi:hypothetical protein